MNAPTRRWKARELMRCGAQLEAINSTDKEVVRVYVLENASHSREFFQDASHRSRATLRD